MYEKWTQERSFLFSERCKCMHEWEGRRGLKGGEELPVREEMGFHAITVNYKWLQLGGQSLSSELVGRKVQSEHNSNQFPWPLAGV